MGGLLLAACGSSGAPDDGARSGQDVVPFAPTPSADPFYAQPAAMPDAPPGTILDSRPITFAPLAGIPLPNAAWQLKFVSRDVNGQPFAAIATVAKPLLPRPGGSPLLAYQYAEDSLGSQCAASRTLSGGTDNPVSQQEGANHLLLLQAGWTVVYPDHEGPYSAYAAGPLAGQITLDSIRAALSFEELGLDAEETPVAMWGYSGGAIATAWAAAMQERYAPELNIVGAATGGTPVDGISIMRNVDTNVVANLTTFALILSAIEGVNRVYPQFVTPILNEQGRAAFESLKDGCAGNTSDGSPAPRGRFADYTTVDPYGSPGVLEVGPLVTLPREGFSPVADTFVYHSFLDQLIPIADVDKAVDAWCADGSPVRYYRGISGEHVAFGVSMIAPVVAYLESRVAGTGLTVTPPGTSSCN